jgi:hypothetical protein
MKPNLFLVTAILLTGLFFRATCNDTIYVTESGAGSKNGTSWQHAYDSLQSAIDNAKSGDLVWVAKGIYYPTKLLPSKTTSRYKSFQMKNGVKVYGGFAGGEKHMERRDVQKNVTTLSGNFGQIGEISDNAYHVVSCTGPLSASTILDGFTIKHGNADGDGNEGYGGGIAIGPSAAIKIQNCLIYWNNAKFGGGGIYSINSSSCIKDCNINNNNSGNGGGIFLSNSADIVTRCHILSNSAEQGANIYASSFHGVILTNKIASGNVNATVGIGYKGGGIYLSGASGMASISSNLILSNHSWYGAGIYLNSVESLIENNLIKDNNSKESGAGIYVYNIATTSFSYLINNTIISNRNTATIPGSGAGIYHKNGVIRVKNNIVSENYIDVPGEVQDFVSEDTTHIHDHGYNHIQVSGYLWKGKGNVTGKPEKTLLEYKDITLPGSGFITSVAEPGIGSFYIDKGDTASVDGQPVPKKDMAGNFRIGRPDMGASEFISFASEFKVTKTTHNSVQMEVSLTNDTVSYILTGKKATGSLDGPVFTNGKTYKPDANLGAGEEVINGWSVLATGNKKKLTIKGLSPETEYALAIHSSYYDGSFPIVYLPGTLYTKTFTTGSESTSVPENKAYDFELFPNPAKDHINISLKSATSYTIMMVSGEGRIVHRGSGMGSQIQLETRHLPGGIYIMQITTPQGTGWAKCIIEK